MKVVPGKMWFDEQTFRPMKGFEFSICPEDVMDAKGKGELDKLKASLRADFELFLEELTK